MSQDAIAIVRKAYDAFARGDRELIESVIAADFRFTSPFDNNIDRKTYFDRCWKNADLIGGFDLKSAIRDGERVFVTYEAELKSGKSFRNAEVYTVRDGKITDVEVYFGWSVPHAAANGGSVEPPKE